MKKVLIDLNILLDFLVQRDFHEIAAEIINRCFENRLEGYLCAHEIAALSCFLDKKFKDEATLKTIIATVLDGFSIIPADKQTFHDALLSPLKDYEDALIESGAYALGLDCIITRKARGFRLSRIPVLRPEDFLDSGVI